MSWPDAGGKHIALNINMMFLNAQLSDFCLSKLHIQ